MAFGQEVPSATPVEFYVPIIRDAATRGGSLGVVSDALSARFGGKTQTWNRYLHRILSGQVSTINEGRDDQLRVFFDLPPARIQVRTTEPMWLVRGIDEKGLQRTWRVTRKAAALKRVRYLEEKGSLMGVSQATVQWAPIDPGALEPQPVHVPRTKCRKGHDLTGKGSVSTKRQGRNIWQVCAKCQAAAKKAWYETNKEHKKKRRKEILEQHGIAAGA